MGEVSSFSSLYIGILAATTMQVAHDWNKSFQFPLHRDPRCNAARSGRRPTASTFQFPLHRDPRCNSGRKWLLWLAYCFSSLYIGILAATLTVQNKERAVARFSSLYIGILAATAGVFVAAWETLGGFSSLYIGILAATSPLRFQ